MKLEIKIKELELELLKPGVRKDTQKLNELLTDDFIEFTSIGFISNKKDILKRLPKLEPTKWTINNFKFKKLSEDVVLVNYKAIKNILKNKKVSVSLRSSIWKKINNNWQMVFHQGTLLK